MTKRFRGFTLVELLVVVGIIALLISILLPSLSRAREQARMTKCLSNEREIGKNAAVFQNSHRDRLQLVAGEGAIDRVDPQRNIYEYFESKNPGAINDIRNRELLTWVVAYAEVSGINLEKKNWNWGARVEDFVEAQTAQGEKAFSNDAVGWVTCPSDKNPLGSPGAPHTNQMLNAGIVQIQELDVPANYRNAAANYYGQLSFAINEDIVGSEMPTTGGGGGGGQNATVTPGCYKADPQSPGVGFLGGVDQKAGPRLAGNIDKVFQPSRTLLFVDAGDDLGPTLGGNERVYTVSTDSAVVSGSEVRAHLGSFTNARMQNVQGADDRQVIPIKRHSDGAVNALKADFSGEQLRPVQFNEISSSGPRRMVPCLYADLTWITPYDVGAEFQPDLDCDSTGP
jgi:prepilin-type N-terminal cleavage/methylation domain-containing protein